ncbi:MAG: hypothetical protein JXA44_07685 [Methanospirillaceae archaeon]|nr:hypothetical protein [Methanospirillaceae archaeon]
MNMSHKPVPVLLPGRRSSLLLLILIGMFFCCVGTAAEQTLYHPGSSGGSVSTGTVYLFLFPSEQKSVSGDLLLGYVAGATENTVVLINGKGNPDDPFMQLDMITPEKSGIFLYLIPQKEQDKRYFQAVAITGQEIIPSEVTPHYPVDFNAGAGSFIDSGTGSSLVPKQPFSPAVTVIPTPKQTSVPVAVAQYSSLTLMADTMSPTVGSSVTLTGRLTDSTGEGIARASIGIFVPEISGQPSQTPLVSARTGNDGRYQTAIQTWQPGTVAIYSSYSGDSVHMPAKSNQIMISARN